MVVSTNARAAKQISFPGMDSGEEFRFAFLRHPIVLWKSGAYVLFLTLIFVIACVISGVMDMDDRPTARVIATALCLFFVIVQLWFIGRLYRYHLRVVIATDKRIHQFKRTLLTTDRHESIDLWVLQDILKLQQSVAQNLFGFGTLKLEAQNTQMNLFFVPHIDHIYNQIIHLREEARERTYPSPLPLEAEIPVQPT